MPTFDFHCNTCEYDWEVWHGIHESHPDSCPECCRKTIRQVYGAPIVLAKGNPTTFGQQSELNERRLGKERVAKLKEKIRNPQKADTLKLPKGAKPFKGTDPKLPWWRDGSMKGLPKSEKPINLNKVKNVKKYIEQGK